MPVAQRDHGPAGRGADGTPAGQAAGGRTSPGPRWPARAVAWLAPFAVALGVLLARNAYLFTTPEYERADMGANSILIEQARRFTLLTGNYSRKGFNHPGPAFLYVESWGESLFWAALRLVPTAWNGQLIALYALNAAFAAGVVAVAYGWTRSARGALAAGAATACFAAVHPAAFSSDWMPFVYVPAFLLFTVALASTAAGRATDSWLAALSGWFLIHGHAAFLFIVPAMAAAAALPAARRALPAARRALRARPPLRAAPSPPATDGSIAQPASIEAGGCAIHPLRRWRRRPGWLPAAVISALFALPMILQLALHGWANFGRYLAYGASGSAGGHSAAQVAGFVLWFWWPRGGAWAAPALLAAAALLLTWRLPAGPARRLCRALLLTDALTLVMVVGYTAVGVDQIGDYYIGYFSWAAPGLLVLVTALAGAELLARVIPARAATAVTAAAALAACAAFAVAPGTRTSTTVVDPVSPPAGVPVDRELPAAVAAMGALAAGRVIVLTFPHDGWSDVTGILVQAGRTGVRACVAARSWAFLMSAASICTPREAGNGYRMTVYPAGQAPPGAHQVARLQRAIVTTGTRAT